MFHYKLNISCAEPKVVQIGSPTCAWLVNPAIGKKGHRISRYFWRRSLICLSVSWPRPKHPLKTRQQSIVPAASYMSNSRPWDCLSSVGLEGKQNLIV